MIKLCIFDLDGTLLSTLDTIRFHLNNTLLSHGLSEITRDECRAFIGNGARRLVERAVFKSRKNIDARTLDEILSEYNRTYDRAPIPDTFIYDGIPELLASLSAKGIRTAVLTNKPEPTARKLVEHFFASSVSYTLGGRSDIRLKPEPAGALKIAESFGVRPDECAFIGDTSVDIRTGENMRAGLKIGVLWGFRDRADLEEAGADFITDKADEILSYIDEFNRSGEV